MPTALEQAIVRALEVCEARREAQGGTRELSLVRTKLEEAHMWATSDTRLRALKERA